MGMLDKDLMIELDEDGFLIDPQRWTEAVARRLAERDGIGELTEDHWKIIRTLRDHYLRTGAMPPEQHICHENHLDRHCVERLFGNSLREAWRVAGLPNPGEEAKAYMI